MKGSIRQRTKGSWEICIDIGKNPATGKRLRHFESIKGRKADAQKRLAELLVSVEQGAYVKPTRFTVAQFLEEWLQSHVALNCSPRTRVSYEMIIRRHIVPELGNIPLNQLEPRHLQTFYSRKKADARVNGKGPLSARTVRYCHSLLREALGHAVKMGSLGRNVAQAIEAPRLDHKVMSTLAAEDVPVFLGVAKGTPYYVLFYTLLYTGMRRGEALALKWRNVDLDLAQIYIVETAYKLRGAYIVKEPKTQQSRRLIDIPPSLALALRQHRIEQEKQQVLLGRILTGDDFVFARPDGTPLDPATVSHAFRKIICKAGLPHVRLHDLRHTFATIMLQSGVHPRVVQGMLGHSSIRVTLDTYSHVVPGLQKAAAQNFDDFISARGSRGSDKANADGMSAKCRQEDSEQISGWPDLNRRPPEPHSGALPGCATPRGFALGNMLS